MKPTTISFQSLLRLSKLGGTIQRAPDIKSSYLPTITTSNNLYRQRILASDKSVGPRSSLITTSGSITDKVRQTKLPMPCLVTFSGVLRRKKPFEPRTSRFCTACSPCWPEYLAFWQANQVNSFLSTKSLYAEQLSFSSCTSFGTLSKTKQLLRILTPTSEV